MEEIISVCHISIVAAKLAEAAQLWDTFEEIAAELSSWVDSTAPSVSTELVVSDLEQVVAQLDQHKVYSDLYNLEFN